MKKLTAILFALVSVLGGCATELDTSEDVDVQEVALEGPVVFGLGDALANFQRFVDDVVYEVELILGMQGSFMVRGISFLLPEECLGREVTIGYRLLQAGQSLEDGFDQIFMPSRGQLIEDRESLLQGIYFEFASSSGCFSMQETILVSFQEEGGERVDSSRDVILIPPGCTN